jgi:hypothetical protein
MWPFRFVVCKTTGCKKWPWGKLWGKVRSERGRPEPQVLVLLAHLIDLRCGLELRGFFFGQPQSARIGWQPMPNGTRNGPRPVLGWQIQREQSQGLTESAR